MPTMAEICADLGAEHDDLDALVARLDEAGWSTDTPAEGWTVRDQISHLNYFDECAIRAATDPDEFREWVRTSAMTEIRPDEGEAADVAVGRSVSGADLLARWRSGRASLLEAFAPLDPKLRIPWFGPDMSAVSFATARLMETWAHGQDVADALGTQRPSSDRLKHICHIGVTAIPWSFTVRKLDVPTEPIRVEVKAPSGETWTWGPEDAENVVRGSALDLALVVTQRRHPDDTDVEATGSVAALWLSIAQAFAGPPGPGRKAGQFA
jgi:uncharacterized protein (TIGR03084 family)